MNVITAMSYSKGGVSALALALVNQKLACKEFLLEHDLKFCLKNAVEEVEKLDPLTCLTQNASFVNKKYTLCCFANSVHLAFLITGIDSEKTLLIQQLMKAWSIDYESYRMILETIKLMDGQDFKIALGI